MIIDPQSFVPLEIDRRLAAARPAKPPVGLPTRHRVRRPRRGLVLRVAAWVTGRSAHV